MPAHLYGILTLTVLFLTPFLDAFTKQGTAVWAPYPLAVLTALWWRGRIAVLWVTGGAIALTVLGAWFSPAGDPHLGLVNRIIGVVLISLVGWICLRLDRNDRELRSREEQLRQHGEELLSATERLGEANQKLQTLSSRDGLTGIANRRQLDLVLNSEWQRARRQGALFSLVLIDIDYFKLYNDTYGHQAGDDCLRQVAGVLSAALKRPGDLIGRYGGEEFLVLLPETDERGARYIAEALRASVNALGIVHESSKIGKHVTVSVGAATVKASPVEKLTDLIDAADQALYRAKENGRNRVESYHAQPWGSDKLVAKPK